MADALDISISVVQYICLNNQWNDAVRHIAISLMLHTELHAWCIVPNGDYNNPTDIWATEAAIYMHYMQSALPLKM